MNKKLNILFLNSWYPNEIQPFNGNFVQEHARAVSLYNNVGCLNVEYRDQVELFSISKTYNKGLLEVIVYIKKPNGLFNFYKRTKRRHEAYLKGFDVINKELEGIDVTHLNVVLPAGLFALYLKRKHKIPFIITEHSTLYLDSNKHNHTFLQLIVTKRVIKNAFKICPVSFDLKKEMISKGYLGDYKVIPNVVNTDNFKYTGKEFDTIINIVHISSLKEEHKNGSGILRVIKRLRENRKDFNFTIVSDSDTSLIADYAKKLGFNDSFFQLKGPMNTEEVAKEMQQQDLFLLFSNYENLPCVISESLVSGMPVISTDVGGINEMLTYKNGVLIEPKNEEMLFNKLNEVLDNMNLFNRKKIAEEAKKTYGYQVVSKQYSEIYNKALNQ